MKRLCYLGVPLAAFSALTCQTASAEALPRETGLNFSVSGQAQSAPDLLTIHLYGQTEDASSVEAQNALNSLIAKALKLSASAGKVTARAGSYSVYDNSSKHEPTHWTARQTLSLSSKDAVHLLEIAGKLQNMGLLMDRVEWSLAPSTHDRLQEEAKTEALKKVQREADLSAKTLNLHVLGLKQISIEADDSRPIAVMMAADSASAAVPPQATQETQTVSVTVTVQAIIGSGQ